MGRDEKGKESGAPTRRGALATRAEIQARLAVIVGGTLALGVHEHRAVRHEIRLQERGDLAIDDHATAAALALVGGALGGRLHVAAAARDRMATAFGAEELRIAAVFLGDGRSRHGDHLKRRGCDAEHEHCRRQRVRWLCSQAACGFYD